MALAKTEERAVKARNPLSNPLLRRFWIGLVISMSGDQLYFIALPWVILGLTHSALAVSKVMAIAAIPRVLLIVGGGVASDRISPRRIMICTALLRAVLLFAIGSLLGSHLLRMTYLYVFALLFGVADAFALPASETYIPYLVSGDELLHAGALLGSTASVLTLVGAPLGGVLLSLLHAPWAFVLDGFSFLPAALILATMPEGRRPAESSGNTMWRTLADGFAYLKLHSALGSLMLLSALFTFCFEGPIVVGVPYLASHVLHSLTAFTVLLSSAAAGALLGSLLAPAFARLHRKVILSCGAVVAGTCLCLLGMFSMLPVLCGLLLVLSFAVTCVSQHVTLWIQQYVAPEMRGRMMSLAMLVSLGLTPLSIALAGPLVEGSLKLTFALAGAGLLLAGAFSTQLKIPAASASG